MSDAPLVLVESVHPFVRRLILNRPDKRNALSNHLRGALFKALEDADRDPDVRVTILRGAGSCFSAGYDLVTRESGRHVQGLPSARRRRCRRMGAVTSVEGCFRVFGISQSRSSRRFTVGVLRVDRSWRQPPTSSTSPKMRRSAIRPCA